MLIDLLESSKAIGLCPMGTHILRHYLYMHAQPSLVGLEPNRVANFCSAFSSPTMFLHVCYLFAETVKTVRR